MRIAVCDDERVEREKTVAALGTVLSEFTVSEFESGDELVKSHGERAFELIILDIIMPGQNGMETASRLREKDSATPIVFISSSEEFGVQSYSVLAFDYILKPIDTERLRSCINRLPERREHKQFITVTYSGTKTDILLSNIQCAESNLRKVIFTLSGNRELEIAGKLADFEEYLLANGFCRCHKSYIVNIEHIDSIDSDTFYLTGGKAIKISRTYLQSAKKAYFDYVFASEVRT